MKLNGGSLILLVIFVTVIGLVSFPVQAQPAGQWAADHRIPGYLDDTFTPLLLADQNRTVHAFASQWIDDGSRRLAIVYRRWSLAGGWTRPVDVILASSGNATLLGGFLDASGTIHILFGEGETRSLNIYYSFAQADVADLVDAWSAPMIIGPGLSGVNSAALSGDEWGNLVVIYSGNMDGSGVYAVQSADTGRTWSDPLQIFAPNDSEFTPYSLRLTAAREKQIQAAWNVVSPLGVDEELYFSNYDIASGKWTKPVELDKRVDVPDYFGPSFPAIVDTSDEIVIMYNGGNPFSGRSVDYGRPVQRVVVSEDAGQTWSKSVSPFPFHVGRSGEHSLTLDGADRPHAMFVQRIEFEVNGRYAIIGGIWHSVFENGSWTNPDRFVTTYSPHDVRAIVVQGNVLLVVWREDPGEGMHGVWYSYFVLDIPEAPVMPPATATALPAENPVGINETPIVVSTNVDTTSLAPLATPTSVKLTASQREILDANPSPSRPIVIGALVAIVVLAGVIVWYRFFRARR